MPFVSGVIQVGDSAPVLLEQEVAILFVGFVKNVGKRTAFLGGPDVSPDNGFPFAPGEIIQADMESKSQAWAIADSGGTELRWLTVT